MGELEEKLNSILSSPKDMEKIMDMARSLSGSMGKQEEKKQEQKATLPFGDIDPKMIGLMTRLMREYNTKEHDKTALLSAMKPYVRAENRDALDKAGSVLKMTQLAKIALSELGGRENDKA